MGVTVLPAQGFQARIPMLQILQVLDQYKERKAFKADQTRLSQVLEQIENDPERRGYYISQSLPRMQSRQGQQTMLQWAGRPGGVPGKEELYTLKPEERLVTGAGEERARGIPKAGKTGEVKIVKPGEHVWDPTAGKDVFSVPADATNAKRYKLAPNQILMDAQGKEIARAPGKPPEEMGEKEVGQMIQKYTQLETQLIAGTPLQQLLSSVSPEIAKKLAGRDINESLKVIHEEKQFWTDRMIEVQAKRMYPRKKLSRDQKGMFILIKGKKHYFRLKEPKPRVR